MASEQEIIQAIRSANNDEIKIRILDQLGHKIKPQHRELIRFLVDLSRDEGPQDISYAVKRALFQIRSRYNITNFPLFLMDPVSLLQSSDPAYRVKALEIFEKKKITSEQCYYFLGAIYFENDPFVLSKIMRVLPRLSTNLPTTRIELILQEYIEHSDSRVRANALEAYTTVSERSREEQVGLLFQCLEDPDQRVRSNALRQLCQDSSENLYDKTWEIIQKSKNYYAVLSCIELIETCPIKKLDEQLDFARKRLAKLEKELAPKSLNVIPQIHVTDVKQDGPVIIPYAKFASWLVYLLPMLLALIIYHKYSENSRLNLKEELKKTSSELRQFEKMVEDQKTRIERLKNYSKVLIVDQDLTSKEKLNLFREDGRRLRTNANAFYRKAKESFDKEEYAVTVKLYNALYDVYKDNRLAVDSVRGLSKTQKIQNVMASVRDYLSKNQFLSASKKIQEIRHLMPKKNYETHVNNIEKAKTKKKD
ncbi:MAG: HEAT repeat domain-containing protein [bacterium]|nr:HEAT repeat domain-containing protein [bacterium]